jgi:SET and MYND domain-containing protein
VPPTSHPRLALSRLAQSLLISQLQPDNNSGPSIDQIIRISSQNRDALVQILHEGHPIRAIATAELGQLLCVDEPPASSDNDAVDWAPRGYTRLALAKDILLRARSEVEIGFGSEGSQLSDTIRESLVNITREMDVFKSGVRNVAATS